MKLQSQVFPSVSTEWPFQSHLLGTDPLTEETLRATIQPLPHADETIMLVYIPCMNTLQSM